MLTPSQAARRRDDTGARLHQPWVDADALRVHLRSGQLAMLVAAPGVGKSVLATAYSMQCGHRVLYLSMDTDAYTTSTRLIAAARGVTLAEAEQELELEKPEALAALDEINNIRFAFTSSPDEQEVGDRLLAYRESEGEFPDLMVVDNLANVAVDDADEFGGLRRLMRDFQWTAGATGVSTLVLHHATGEYENGVDAVPLKGVSGKISKFPSLILTAHRGGAGSINVDVVKNRFGRADPAASGAARFVLGVDMEKMTVFKDPAPLVQGWGRTS